MPSKKHQSNDFWDKIDRLAEQSDKITLGLGPGPQFIPFNWNINVNKGSLSILIFAMMVYYQNFDFGMWIYLVLHGSYGIMWFAKDRVYPDKNHQGNQTLLSASIVWIVAGPYYTFGWLMASGITDSNPDIERVAVACIVYVTGLVIVMGADAQKYFTLGKQKGLISDGYFKYTHNPNYLGEMMLYSAFAILVNHWWPWLYLGLVWVFIFSQLMLIKESSLRRKDGFEEYSQGSWFLIPKLGGSFLLSWSIYVAVIGTIIMVYFIGGGVQGFFEDFGQSIEAFQNIELMKEFRNHPFFKAYIQGRRP